MMLCYRLEFDHDDNGTVLVTSPDFPVVTYGDDKISATKNALDAIEALLQSMMDHRENIPRSRGAARDDCASLSLQTELKVALYVAMREAGMTRADLQRALGWQRESVDRLFRLDHNSKIDQLERGFAALGKRVSPVVAAARDAA